MLAFVAASGCHVRLHLGENLDAGADASLDSDCPSGNVCAGRCLGGGWAIEQVEVATAKESLGGHGGDLDGDGFTDAIFDDQYSETMTVYWGGPNFALVNATTVVSGRVNRPAAVGDFDRDGIGDYVILTQRSGPPDSTHLTFVFGDTTRHLTRMAHRAQAGNPQSVAALDVTQDGYLDVLVTLPSQSCVALLVGHGDGTFDDSVCAFAAPSTVDPGGELIPLSDGTLLVWSLRSLRRVWLDTLGNVTRTEEFASSATYDPAFPSADDFDHDGRRDVALLKFHYGVEYGVDAGASRASLEIRFAEPDGGFSPCDFQQIPAFPRLAGYPYAALPDNFADLNGDGLPDGFGAATCGACASVHSVLRRTP